MGDPRKQKKKFSTPSHPWQKERIDEEKDLIREYGLKNKKEIWKMDSFLKKSFLQAKKLSADKTKQGEKEKIQLLTKLKLLGLLPEAAHLDDVLELTLKDILERRLQSIIFRKGLARSMKQARQFITHEHIAVNSKKITAPGFLVSKKNEDRIDFSPKSKLIDEMHPERIQKKETMQIKKKPQKDKKEIKNKKQKKITKKTTEKKSKKTLGNKQKKVSQKDIKQGEN